jgi:hypothetical protein
MATAQAQAPASPWIDAKTAAALLRVPSTRNVVQMADAGQITTMHPPGSRRLYLQSDVARIARDSIRPADHFSR